MNIDVSEKRTNFVFKVEFNEMNLWLDNTDRCATLLATVLLHTYFDPEDGGSMFLRNVCVHLQLHGVTTKNTVI